MALEYLDVNQIWSTYLSRGSYLIYIQIVMCDHNCVGHIVQLLSRSTTNIATTIMIATRNIYPATNVPDVNNLK